MTETFAVSSLQRVARRTSSGANGEGHARTIVDVPALTLGEICLITWSGFKPREGMQASSGAIPAQSPCKTCQISREYGKRQSLDCLTKVPLSYLKA